MDTCEKGVFKKIKIHYFKIWEICQATTRQRTRFRTLRGCYRAIRTSWRDARLAWTDDGLASNSPPPSYHRCPLSWHDGYDDNKNGIKMSHQTKWIWSSFQFRKRLTMCAPTRPFRMKTAKISAISMLSARKPSEYSHSAHCQLLFRILSTHPYARGVVKWTFWTYFVLLLI